MGSHSFSTSAFSYIFIFPANAMEKLVQDTEVMFTPPDKIISMKEMNRLKKQMKDEEEMKEREKLAVEGKEASTRRNRGERRVASKLSGGSRDGTQLKKALSFGE